MSEYSGQIEYAGGATAYADIDDVDSVNWRGDPRTILFRADAPAVWYVGVHLLEGERAGQFATADLHRGTPRAFFLGREPFGPAPPGVEPLTPSRLAHPWGPAHERRLARLGGWRSAGSSRLVAVYPVNQRLERPDGQVTLCSVEVWTDRLILRTAGSSTGGFWLLGDDAGTVYRWFGGGGGGGDDLMVGYSAYNAPRPEARHLYLSSPLSGLPPLDIALEPGTP